MSQGGIKQQSLSLKEDGRHQKKLKKGKIGKTNRILMSKSTATIQKFSEKPGEEKRSP